MAFQKALPRSLFAFLEKYVLTSGYFLPIFTSVLSEILEVPWHVNSLRGRLVFARQHLTIPFQLSGYRIRGPSHSKNARHHLLWAYHEQRVCLYVRGAYRASVFAKRSSQSTAFCKLYCLPITST